MSELSELAARLVAIDSVNPGLVPGGGGEREIAAFVGGWCAERGLSVEVVGGDRPSVIAVKRGSGGGRSLLLNGHLDTVGVAGMSEPYEPRLEDGRLYGRGAYDMKGALAAILLAAAEASGLRGDLIVTAVADEELASTGTEAVLERVRADAAIVVEPTDLRLAVAHRGFVGFELETTVLYKRVGPPLLTVAPVPGLSGTRFVRTSVTSQDGKVLGSNFYWTNPDTKSVWPAGSRTVRNTNSPTTWTDYTAIRTTLKGTAAIPVAPVKVTAEVKDASSPEPGWAALTVKLTNTGNLPALQIHVYGVDENGEQILPFIADDNYVTLMPGESRTLSVKYELARRQGDATIVRFDGFNVAEGVALAVTITPDRAPDHNGWYNHPVTFTATAQAVAGVDISCDAPKVYSGPDSATASVTLNCADNLGDTASRTVTFKYDATAPVLAPTVSPNLVAFGGTATASANATDAPSGVASQSCDPVPTSVAGVHTVSCTATDLAGNTASATASYTVASPLGTGSTSCIGPFSGSGKDVVVPAGATCTLLAGTHVSHDVQVQKGGTLNDLGAVIDHDLSADQPAGVQVAGGSVGHDLSINGLSGAPAGGNYVRDATVVHDLIVQNSVAAIVVSGNTVGHDLTVKGNQPGGATISGNTAGHDAVCQSNSPQGGSGNTAVHANSCPA